MHPRLLLVAILLSVLSIGPSSRPSYAQTPDQPTPPPSIMQAPAFTPPLDEPHRAECTTREQEDVVFLLRALRENVRTSPQNADDRVKLAEALYRIGDLDTSIDECRMAIALKPDHALAHLQLGRALMAKQDWRAALTELKDAARLNPELTQAHYNLGTAYYTTGNIKGAIQSYQQALALQPSFPDARYRLALVLKLARRDQESAQFMEEAAASGVPQAQFFLGNAYRIGLGLDKNGSLAVYWWAKAVEFGHQPAAFALSILRRQALSPIQPEPHRVEALKAFQGYREKIWEGFPDLARNGDSKTLGTTLLKQSRHDQAVPVLLQECYALSDMAQAELARLYETGWEPHLAPFDKQILSCFKTTAGDGFEPAKKILARIYGKGLGMKPDRQKAITAVRGLPKQDVKAVLDELSLQP